MTKFSLRAMAALIAITVLVVNGAKAQAPQAVPYQAVVRNTAGNAIANKTVALRFSIRDAAATGTVVYQERQSAITNALGLFSVNVGQGTVATGTFSGIDWAGNTKFLQIEVDTTGGTTYISMGTQQLLSVPYALNAKKADSASNGVPTGTIEAFAGDTSSIPSGWVLCDGRSVNTTDPKYANLFKIIKNYWGTAGTGKFNLPDTRGLFLRGQAIGSAWDPDRASRLAWAAGGNTGDAVGSIQGSGFASHNHTLTDPGHTHNIPTNSGVGGGYTEVPQGNGNQYDYLPATPVSSSQTGITINAAGGSETRPANVYVNYIIKL